MPQIENTLSALSGDIKGYVQRTESKLGALQQQVDSIDLKTATRHAGYAPPSSIEKTLKESDQIERLLRDKKGAAYIKFGPKEISEFKTTITETAAGAGLGPVGTQTPGVLPLERIPGITQEARQSLKIRDVLFARPTTAAVIDFVRVQTPMQIASPVPEASTKPENAVTFSTVSERVKTIATWIPASRQVLDDFAELNGFLTSSLGFYVNKAEELELLSGSGTGEDLNGLITQASAFSQSLLSMSAGWNRLDLIGRAVQQITAGSEVAPTFCVLNPSDYWGIRLTKDGFGRYILGDPQMPVVRPQIFGLDLVATNSIAAGTFLVGSGDPAAAEIRDRMELQVEISTEHADYFTRNLVAVRAEKRLALIVKRPHSFVTGSFASSPVS